MMKKWIKIGCGLMILIIIVTREVSFKKTGRIEYKKFFQTSIDGKLSYIGVSSGAVYINVEGNDEEYMMIPIQQNSDRYFGFFASVGDRILKKPYSDTLRLFKRSKIYIYVVQKIN